LAHPPRQLRSFHTHPYGAVAPDTSTLVDLAVVLALSPGFGPFCPEHNCKIDEPATA